MTIHLERLSETHRDAFCAMQSEHAVMADLGGPFERADSDAKFDRYVAAWRDHGVSRWAVVDDVGAFLGYCGVMWRDTVEHPLGRHHEIGWRLCQKTWGNGFATTSARRALDHAWQVIDTNVIYAYTAADNLRSRRVMQKIPLRREAGSDFTAFYEIGPWQGLVWVADRPR
jgi:RimJ/RimL family protein N-acetyltransferase